MLHDLLIAIGFIAMVAAPAMVATLGGKKEYQPEPEPETTPRLRVVPAPTARVIHPHSTEFVAPRSVAAGRPVPAPTLPIRARGMMDR
jgi:hypothetical protein